MQDKTYNGSNDNTGSWAQHIGWVHQWSKSLKTFHNGGLFTNILFWKNIGIHLMYDMYANKNVCTSHPVGQLSVVYCPLNAVIPHILYDCTLSIVNYCWVVSTNIYWFTENDALPKTLTTN